MQQDDDVGTVLQCPLIAGLLVGAVSAVRRMNVEQGAELARLCEMVPSLLVSSTTITSSATPAGMSRIVRASVTSASYAGRVMTTLATQLPR